MVALSASVTKLVAVAVVATLLGLAGGFFLPGMRTDLSANAAKAQAASKESDVPIYGFVLDYEFNPIVNATLTVVETEAAFRSAGDGSYDIVATPGNYLVVASAYGYRSAAAALSVLYGQSTRHDFFLEPKPVGDPYYQILPFTAVIGCQVAVGLNAVDCSAAFSPNRLVTNTPIPESTANALTEVHWQAQSVLATHLSLHSTMVIGTTSLEVASMRATTGMKLWLLDSFLHSHLEPGAEWRQQLELAAPFGEDDMYGNKGGTGIGYAQDQSIDVFTTLFHYAAGPGNFTATEA
jgi:hypothetical protein